ncbi:MAG: hypothetical protein WD533_09775 [Dehalococcoidia bacterium]
MMIRELRLSDMPRQLIPGGLGGEDWAYTRAAVSTGTAQFSRMDLLRWSVGGAKARQGVACVEGGRLLGAALLQARRGVRAWEVAHLVTAPSALDRAGDLLERCVGYAAQCGGETLFLRVLDGSEMQGIARRAGFMPAYTEEVFTLSRAIISDADTPGLPMRPALAMDAHGIFRLYNASAPVQVRQMTGLTLDQWSAAVEELGGGLREYVWEAGGLAHAWLRVARCGKGVAVDALLHPEDAGKAGELVLTAGRLAGPHAFVAWTVPGYQPAISLALQRRGWELQRTFAVLARPAARRVTEPAMMPVQA